MIAVIDYKAGNLTSVLKALDSLGVKDAIVTARPEDVRSADRIILPGVGHFAATRLLAQTGLTEAIRDAISGKKPFLGICVGMQWLFEGSTEAPEVRGLGVLPGVCNRFPATVKSPHVGWNSLQISPSTRLLAKVPGEAFVYFTHSYRAPLTEASAATTEYGDRFAAAVERNNIMGVQFHPEKSGEAGLQVLRNVLTC
jgi:glutamine amidotransferase